MAHAPTNCVYEIDARPMYESHVYRHKDCLRIRTDEPRAPPGRSGQPYPKARAHCLQQPYTVCSSSLRAAMGTSDFGCYSLHGTRKGDTAHTPTGALFDRLGVLFHTAYSSHAIARAAKGIHWSERRWELHVILHGSHGMTDSKSTH